MVETRCGFIAVLGLPNAGKSTLINKFVGQKVSIVSPKVQTTRMRVLGLTIAQSSQLIFIDTPGVFASQRRGDQKLAEVATQAAADADLRMVLVDVASKPNIHLIQEMLQKWKPAILVLNKIDRVDRSLLLALTQDMTQGQDVKAVFMISALRDDGVEALKSYLAEQVPLAPWLYPEDTLTDQSTKDWAAEITREQVYMQLQDELPYEVRVETEQYETRDNGEAVIHQVLLVSREGQRRILIGEKGKRIQSISRASRLEITRNLGHPVHLFLHVQVRPKRAE